MSMVLPAHAIQQQLRTELLGMLGQLGRRRWLILGIAWLICGIGWSATMMWPNRYESRARIYVEGDTLLSPLLKGMSVVPNVEKQATVMQRTLLSRQNLEAVLRDTRPELDSKDIAAWSAALAALEAATRIQPEGGRDSRLFLLTYLDHDPQMAKRVVQTLLNIFISRSTEASRNDLAEAKQFIDAQLVHYEGLLREAEARLADFKRRNVDMPQLGNYAQAVEAARLRLNDVSAQLEEAKTRKRAMEDELARTPQHLSLDGSPQVVINGTAQSGPAAQLALLESKLNELRLRYTDKHPDVIATRRLIDELSGQIARGEVRSVTAAAAARRQQVLNPVHEQIRLKLVDLEGEVRMLTRRHDDQKAEVERLGKLAATAPALEAELTALNRDYKVLRTNYDELLERRQSAKISGDMQERVEKVQFSVIEQPVAPSVPAVPNRPLLLTLVLMAGPSLGVLVVLVIYQVQRPLVTVQQLRSGFDLPVIGTISRSAAAQATAARGVSRLAFASAAAGLALCYVGLMVWPSLAALIETAGSAL